ncbi:MAG: Tim44-like domain-containing protein, partial [Mariprofundaceae bacterium]
MFFGGAFEGINFFDIVVIGALIALLIWFLRRKAESRPIAYAGGQHGGRGFGHDMQQPAGKMLRPNIDEKHFLTAARDIFMRMQAAWDNRSIEDIRKFCTADIADRIEQDMDAAGRNHTEVVTLHAQLTDSWIESNLEWAAVDFTAMLREQTLDDQGNPVDDQSHEIHETWIFRHDPHADDPTWFLAGIQQA